MPCKATVKMERKKMKKLETKADFYAKYMGRTETFCMVANVQMTM